MTATPKDYRPPYPCPYCGKLDCPGWRDYQHRLDVARGSLPQRPVEAEPETIQRAMAGDR